MTAPIPRRALPSSCAVRVPAREGGGEFGDPVEIRHVRLEAADALRATGYQLRDTATGLLFVDAVSSEGAFAIPAGSLVSVDGGPESCVASCEERRDFGRVHHWEVVLL